jgi:hydroxyacylglutathione hydrolase
VTRRRALLRKGLCVLGLASLLLHAACGINLSHVETPQQTRAIVTAPPWSSMIYLARLDSGIIAIDLGWYGAERALRRELRRWDAQPEDVTDVFLTHSHRDHIAAWKAVRHARFHMAQDEVAHFLEEHAHRDLPSRLATWALGNPAPPPAPVQAHAFSRDTAYVFGADTLHAFVVPGHTAGSTAYLFRGILFVGDATVHMYGVGVGPAMRIFTADVRQSRVSLGSLQARLEGRSVDWICTAHAKCSRPSERYWKKVRRNALL